MVGRSTCGKDGLNVVTEEPIVVVLLHMDDELLVVCLQQLGEASKRLDGDHTPQRLLLKVVHVEVCDDQAPVLLDAVFVPLDDLS